MLEIVEQLEPPDSGKKSQQASLIDAVIREKEAHAPHYFRLARQMTDTLREADYVYGNWEYPKIAREFLTHMKSVYNAEVDD